MWPATGADLVTQPTGLEKAILEHFDHLYLDVEADHTAGAKLIAALGHRYPKYSRAGKTRLMPTVLRALQAWARARSTGTRDALADAGSGRSCDAY